MGVLCGQVSGNPSCEGGDVELCARTSKHIRMLAIDPLSLTLSFTLCLALIHIVISYLHAWFVCVCASLVFNQRELHIAPQLLFRGITRS